MCDPPARISGFALAGSEIWKPARARLGYQSISTHGRKNEASTRPHVEEIQDINTDIARNACGGERDQAKNDSKCGPLSMEDTGRIFDLKEVNNIGEMR